MEKSLNKQNPTAIVVGLGAVCMALLYTALLLSGASKPVIPPLVAKENIEYWLYDAPRSVAGNVSLQYHEELGRLYHDLDYQMVWMDHYELSEAGQSLVRSLRHTASDEWKAYRYRVSKLQNEISRLSNEPKHATAIDILLTDAYIDFSQQVLNNELLPNTGLPPKLPGGHKHLQRLRVLNLSDSLHLEGLHPKSRLSEVRESPRYDSLCDVRAHVCANRYYVVMTFTFGSPGVSGSPALTALKTR